MCVLWTCTSRRIQRPQQNEQKVCDLPEWSTESVWFSDWSVYESVSYALIALLWICSHSAHKHTQTHTSSAQPYGQIMSIMRNTSGGTNSVRGRGGRKSGRRDRRGEEEERTNCLVRLESKDVNEWGREWSSYSDSKWVQTEQVDRDPQRGSAFSHFVLWLNLKCEKHLCCTCCQPKIHLNSLGSGSVR